ncbi:30S ribosome-binding factor RbfA [Atopobacter sp. AH10]|uniref:30S ribosome-binding factor RbfA n=1 Tax=Atopobacter sp. AH10 TaxID=2315861 RepID=UPI000EF26F9E|nr:30S ribosome-binding factor RbfA [Atopobacter sp. AH10]RLK62441.1 30S ribosome-binding factor RbfA [Atopobacter sp. AH10]
MPNYRVERLQQEVLREVTDILAHKVKDPRVSGVTLTEVTVTNDLQIASLYYSTLSDKASERAKTEEGLKKAVGLIRKELAKRLNIYKVPELHFKRDTSVDYGQRIDQLIAQIHQEDAKR